MRKLITLLIFLNTLLTFSQEGAKQIMISELDLEINEESNLLIVKSSGSLLNGLYKIIVDDDTTKFSLSQFQDGKITGTQKSYHGEILTGTTEFKDGKQNGYDVQYDQSGKNMMWKVNYVDGVQHGHSWWADKGDEYYIKGKVSSKFDFEKYEREKND